MMQGVLGFGYIEKKGTSPSSYQPSVKDQAYRFETQTQGDIKKFIIPYFDQYSPRTTNKKVRYSRFRKVFGLIDNKT